MVGNDWLAAFGCCAVLALSWGVLDFTGRRKAAKHPDKRYKHDGLPESPNDKAFKIRFGILTFVVLVVAVATQVKPNASHPSPFPYFTALWFYFVVMPQPLAWRALADNQKPTKKPRPSKRS